MNWDSLKQGKSCPLCLPHIENNASLKQIITLEISTLYLEANQTYRGYSILIFDKYHANGLEALSEDDYGKMMRDLYRAARAIKMLLKPEHMNYASLGNLFPHLHFHLIPRYTNDPRWRKPIWMTDAKDMHQASLSEEEYQSLIKKIRN